jgi:hypothetical protein
MTENTSNVNLSIGAAQQSHALALVALILSCLAFFTGPVTCIPGIICGHLAFNACKKDPGLAGKGMAQAALIIGYIVLLLLVMAGCAIGLFVGLIAASK